MGGNEGPINSGPKNEHVGFDEAILNESFGSMAIGPRTPPRRSDMKVSHLMTAMETENDARVESTEDDRNSTLQQAEVSIGESISMQRQIRHGISNTSSIILSTSKKKKKKSRFGETPGMMRNGMRGQPDKTKLPRRVVLFSDHNETQPDKTR